MTKFCFEVPIAHLKDFEPYQDFTFGLSFLLENQTYEKYFRNKCEARGLVYLDNSYNETQIPASARDLAVLYRIYKPTAIAAPDSDDWDFQTSINAFGNLAYMIGPQNVLAVYRSDEEWSAFTKAGAGVLAVSYWWVNFLHWAQPSASHFLGLESLELLARYQPPTLDTTRMIKLAIEGTTFETWVASGARFTHHYTRSEGNDGSRLKRAWEYFNTKLTDDQLELAIHNIQTLKAASRSLLSGDGQLADQRPTVEQSVQTIPHSVDVEYGTPQTFGVPDDLPYSSPLDS